jgi:hypothetical protein
VTIRQRLDVLEDGLALDRERLRGWGIVHALASAASTGCWSRSSCARAGSPQIR